MTKNSRIHSISIVIPVYNGEKTLKTVIEELSAYTEISESTKGHVYKITEILLSWDHGRDRSDRVIRELEERYSFVHGVWLTRNYGQHAATLAGMSRTTGDWVVTLDEDGLHNPKFISDMLDTALESQADVVYANPSSEITQSGFREWTSRTAKSIASKFMGSAEANKFQSFRLVLGDTARLLATKSGNNAYLDIALTWIANKVVQCPVVYRAGDERPSTYNLTRLISHFWSMIITSGTKPLRIVSSIGAVVSSVGFVWAIVVIIMRITNLIDAVGWSSLMVVMLMLFGLTLFSIGILAEYIGVVVRSTMGMPTYLIGEDPQKGPLGDVYSEDEQQTNEYDGKRLSE
jgi:undecaprenyl-phosphate 4-deoxy-4-formamido-L-arabinose transferase